MNKHTSQDQRLHPELVGRTLCDDCMPFGEEDYEPTVILCPLHAAAAELLKALQGFMFNHNDIEISKDRYRKDARRVGLEIARTRARAAIAKAKEATP